MPEISGDQKDFLDSPIRAEEIKKAISLMMVGKSPGLDGFLPELYKKYVDKLASVLKRVYDESCSLENYQKHLIISLLLKKDKDPTDPGSFRPISLINVDCKPLTKVLAMRLESVLLHLTLGSGGNH